MFVSFTPWSWTLWCVRVIFDSCFHRVLLLAFNHTRVNKECSAVTAYWTGMKISDMLVQIMKAGTTRLLSWAVKFPWPGPGAHWLWFPGIHRCVITQMTAVSLSLEFLVLVIYLSWCGYQPQGGSDNMAPWPPNIASVWPCDGIGRPRFSSLMSLSLGIFVPTLSAASLLLL